ncbi:MAG: patatin-like phospholipase family protein [Bacteroidota bacterium]|nr:patatin-like phospholipase family protein [Bacteroidota bacterium]
MPKNIALSFIFLLIIVKTFSQHQHYRNLIMEGGGVRGFAYIGAFEVLDSLHILGDVQRVGGSSVGAIQAALLATGYTTSEMKTIAANIPLKTFNDGFSLGGFHRLKKSLGFFKGKAVAAWIDTLLKNKTGDDKITFLQLHEQKEAKHYKDLYITGTDLTYQCLRVFSYETYPNMKIKDALRISMSVPLYFQPVYMKDDGSMADKKDSGNIHLMTDGGLLSNYPIQIFDNEKYGDCVSINGQKQNKETLGLLLEKPEQIAYSQHNKGNYPLPIKTVRNYIGAMYRTLVDKPNPEASNGTLLHRTITISNMNVSGRVRQLSPATIDAFVECGRQGVRDFFKQKDQPL